MISNLTVEDVCRWLKVYPDNPFEKIFRELDYPVDAVRYEQRITPRVAIKLVSMYSFRELHRRMG